MVSSSTNDTSPVCGSQRSCFTKPQATMSNPKSGSSMRRSASYLDAFVRNSAPQTGQTHTAASAASTVGGACAAGGAAAEATRRAAQRRRRSLEPLAAALQTGPLLHVPAFSTTLCAPHSGTASIRVLTKYNKRAEKRAQLATATFRWCCEAAIGVRVIGCLGNNRADRGNAVFPSI